MRKTLSGKFNLNEIPRRELLNRNSYVGIDRLPTVRSEPYFAAAYRDNPQKFAFFDSKPLTMRRYVRPHGVY